MTALFCIASDDASWTLKLTESRGESKSDFKEEVDGFKIEEGWDMGAFLFVFKMVATILLPLSFC